MTDPVENRPVLDLSKNLGVIARGDVLVWKTWVLIDGSWQGCLAITPRRNVNHEKTIPCIVPQSRAWAWAEETGNEFDALIAAGLFCANLGFSPFNPKNPLKILRIVRDLLHELLLIPPRPQMDMHAAADMAVLDNRTGKITEIEVRDEIA